MSRPAISVVLPTYNRAHTLDRAVESVLSQSYRDFELIIVDDASTDDTVERVGLLDDARVRLIRLGVNCGVSHARNVGIAESRAELIAFQDSDDLWEPEKLERQVALMRQAREDVGVVYCGLYKQWGVFTEPIPLLNASGISGSILPYLLVSNPVTTPSVLARRACLDEAGGFDESLATHEDWELWLRVARRWKFLFTGDYQVTSPHTPGGVNDADARRFRDAMLAIVEKHTDLYREAPRARARMDHKIGVYAARQGDLSVGRKHLIEAVRRHPALVESWLALGLSLLGPEAFSQVFDRRQRRRFRGVDS